MSSPSWTVLLSGPARKSLRRAPAADRSRLIGALTDLAAVAPKTREATRHHSTGQELPQQLALDQARQPFATTALTGFGQKGLQVLAHDAVQHALLGLAAHVRLAPAAELLCVPARAARRLDLLRAEGAASDFVGAACWVRARHRAQLAHH